MKKVVISHIGYTIYLKDIRKPSKLVKDIMKDKSYNWRACCEKSTHSSTIYMILPVKTVNIPTLCHELIHVFQNICESKGIDFVQEKEHISYLYQYTLNELLGLEYDI